MVLYVVYVMCGTAWSRCDDAMLYIADIVMWYCM